MAGGRSSCASAWPWVSALPSRFWICRDRTGAVSVPGRRPPRSQHWQLRGDCSSVSHRPQMLLPSFLSSPSVSILNPATSQARRTRQPWLPGKAIPSPARPSIGRLSPQLLQMTIQPRAGARRAGRATPVASPSSSASDSRCIPAKGVFLFLEGGNDLEKWGRLGDPMLAPSRQRAQPAASIFIGPGSGKFVAHWALWTRRMDA